MQYSRLVYDFADALPRIGFMLLPLLFVAIGLGIYFYHKKIVDNSATTTFGINKKKYGMVFGIICVSFSGFISVLFIVSMSAEYMRTKYIYDEKQYNTVEGIVENYHPMPAGGHAYESFTVKRIKFEFSDFDLGDYGYNNAASHGGAIREGLKVRISYFNNGHKNVILKLETE
jgi:hypothetical protein